MVLHFNVTKDKRKAMVQAIEKEIGGKAKYLGVPSRLPTKLGVLR